MALTMALAVWLCSGPLALGASGHAASGPFGGARAGGPGSAPLGERVLTAAGADAALATTPTGVWAGTKPAPAAPQQLLVRFRARIGAAQRSRAASAVGATVLHSYRLVPGLELLRLGRGSNRAAAARRLSAQPGVAYAVPDTLKRLQATPNDPLYSKEWGMTAIGAPAAWERSTGSANVIVAVLDTGIVLNHPDLEANLWTNPEPGRFGYTNDLHGWNFIANNNSPADDYGHGTHVSGIIGAAGNNSLGVAGINWHVSLMPLKICNKEGFCSTSDEIQALEYAAQHGAKVANASFGAAYPPEKPEEEAIRAAGNAGVLFVAAAGNSSDNNDKTPFYPASYPLENVISVAASGRTNELAYFSDYGEQSVGLAAPGVEIESTLPTSGPLSSPSGYGELQGTSMAAPQVTGAAALLWSLHPTWTLAQVRARLLSTTTPVAGLAGLVASCGELNIDAATNPATPESASLCVKRIGTGAGTVSSSPAGVECGSSCAAHFAPGTPVTLTATPASGSSFEGWRGPCSGSGTCTVSPSTATSVKAVFRSPGTPAGWFAEPLAPPVGREPFPPGSSTGQSFYNVSLSADATERAKTIFTFPTPFCTYASSDTGGVFLEHRGASGWVSDGSVTAPALGTDPGARWANCSSFGTVTSLSRDGATLLVSAEQAQTSNPQLGTRWRCAAFVYRRQAGGGWSPDGTLYPPGVGAEGAEKIEGCNYFGIGGAISDDGSRIAIQEAAAADVFVRGASGWELEQHIQLPKTNSCNETVGPRTIALSGDGSTLILGQPDCAVAGTLAAGTVYAYDRAGSAWSLAQTIDSPESHFQNNFGQSVAISDDGSTATIGIGRVATGLPSSAGASWVLTSSGGTWTAAARVTAPHPEENTGFTCPTIIEHGAGLVCDAVETVGFNAGQGALYVVRRNAADWSSSSAQRLFAEEGEAGDSLGVTNALKWRVPAASSDGSLIDATVSVTSLASGAYPEDRMGYEFSTAAPAPPSISAVAPGEGPEAGGGRVILTGERMAHVTSVSFGSAPAAKFKVLSAAAIEAETPAGSGTVDVTVADALGTSTTSPADRYTYVPAPTVERLEPAEGPTYGGTTVTVTGTQLGSATSVKFGAVAASFHVVSPTTLTATSPRGTGTVDVTVTAAGGTSAAGPADRFIYANKPPEFGRCLKVALGFGLYGDSGCKTLGGTQTYEWSPAFGGSSPLVKPRLSTRIKAGTELHLETAAKEVISCTGQSSGGEFASNTTVAGVALVLTGCHLGEAGSCQTAGASSGEVQTVSLVGTLGVIKTNATTPLKNQIGLDFEPQAPGAIAEFACAGTPVALRGGVIVPLPANGMTLAATLKFAQLRGVQKPSQFQGQAPRLLEMKIGEGSYQRTGLALTTVLTKEEKVEASTVL